MLRTVALAGCFALTLGPAGQSRRVDLEADDCSRVVMNFDDYETARAVRHTTIPLSIGRLDVRPDSNGRQAPIRSPRASPPARAASRMRRPRPTASVWRSTAIACARRRRTAIGFGPGASSSSLPHRLAPTFRSSLEMVRSRSTGWRARSTCAPRTVRSASAAARARWTSRRRTVRSRSTSTAGTGTGTSRRMRATGRSPSTSRRTTPPESKSRLRRTHRGVATHRRAGAAAATGTIDPGPCASAPIRSSSESAPTTVQFRSAGRVRILQKSIGECHRWACR